MRSARINPAVSWGLLAKLMQGLAGPITVLLIAIYFSPWVQGYHYTFANLLAAQILLELGLSGVIVTFAAHESAKVTLDGNGRVIGDEESLARLRSLASGAFKWFTCGAVVLSIGLAVGGSLFLGSRPESTAISWHAPWLTLCAMTAAYFAVTPAWALLQGCGQVMQINRYKFFEGVMRNLVFCICIVAGAELWSAVITSIFICVAAFTYLFLAYGKFFESLLFHATPLRSIWKSEVMPFQWRIAISYASGYVIFSLFTPVQFYLHGPVVAGQMGLSWALVGGVSGLAYTWVQVNAPEFGKLIATRQYTQLDALALRIAGKQLAIAICLSVVALLVIWLLQAYYGLLASRFLPLLPIALFLVAETMNQVSYVQSTYLRAFKKEPFMGLSVLQAIVVGVGTFVLSAEFGPMGAAISYIVGVTLVVTIGSMIFMRCRREWTFPR